MSTDSPATTDTTSADAPLDAYERPSDEQILFYERQIKEAESQAPLVGPLTSFDKLIAEYADGSPAILAKLRTLSESYAGLRATRRDGNCFYRAIAFRLCELLASRRVSPWVDAVVLRLGPRCREIASEAGYNMDLMGDFADCWEDAIRDGDVEGAMADSVVCWLRLVTAAVLKKNSDLFEAFILDSYPSLELFIGSQVEPMNVEADQPHIVAIATALGITIRIGNLDNSSTAEGVMNWHEIDPLEPLAVTAMVAGDIAAPVVELSWARKPSRILRRWKRGDTSTLVQVAVFRVNDLSHPPHKYKVNVNAGQHNLTGMAILYLGMSVVIVEGSPKGIKAYKKLMVRRIDWANADASGDEEAGTRRCGRRSRAQATNACALVWESDIKERQFRFFRLKTVPTESAAHEFLERMKAVHYWDAARNYVAPGMQQCDCRRYAFGANV
ncbi:hypothetical protein HDU86_003076 [Geranomyces michiganensis]|nr:hypothetical protein HDU86_003076 [Geranomyces michiganensis]